MQVGARVLTPITVKAPHGTASNSGRMSLPHLGLPSTLALGLYYYFDKWCSPKLSKNESCLPPISQ